MNLKNKLTNQGNFLFRHRSFLPLLLIPVILLGIISNTIIIQNPILNLSYNLICIFITLSGFIVRIITIGHAPRGTSGRNRYNQVAHKLNTTGMYSIVRNPLYLGNFLMGLGVTIYVRSIYTVFIFMLIFFLYYERIIYVEEAFLAEKFKDKFIAWVNETPIFIPNFRLWKRSELCFSVTTVLQREYSGFLGSTVSFLFIQIFRDYYQSGHLNIKLSYLYILILAIFITLILRGLRKCTTLLDKEGR